jgi:hypothetical protein
VPRPSVRAILEDPKTTELTGELFYADSVENGYDFAEDGKQPSFFKVNSER